MLNQNPRQTDFVLGTCPSCQKVVRVPVTAVTSQSNSQVKCPICSASFELADVLEETIPSVEVIDEVVNEPVDNRTLPEKINAIDTPELFHGTNKDGYKPKTEKKNGRFVVPELLSKGISKKHKKSRRRSKRSSDDKKRVEKSLAKLKENTAATSLAAGSEKKSRKSSSDKERRGGRVRSSEHRSSGKRGSGRKESSRTSKNVVDFKRLKTTVMSVFEDVKKLMESPKGNLEYVMIGIGALLAIPVLHLVMWWFIGVDPIGLARPTSYVMPVLVPNELQAKAEPGQEDARGIMDSIDEEDQAIPEADFEFELAEDGKLPRPNLDPDSVRSDR